MKNLKTQLAALALSTMCVLTSADAQLAPSADAYTNSALPTSNYGAATLLYVENASAIETAYIQFNLSSIPAGYTGADITKATLKLYVNAVTTAGSFNVDYVNGAWVENKITHNLAPALGTTIVSSVPLTTASKNQYILIDITAAVQAWLNGSEPNDGIALVGNSPLNANFDSKESTSTSHAAELDLVFAGGGTLTGVTTASGSGLTGGGSSGTLSLSLIHTCSTKQVLQWNGSAWACASAGTGTVTSVASGAGLAGGPITGSGTLSIPGAGVTNAMLQNSSLTLTAGGGMTGGGPVSLGGSTTLGLKTCSANQVLEYVGSAWTCTTLSSGGTVTSVATGLGLTGGPITSSGTLSINTTVVPQLGASNTFTGNQTVIGTFGVAGNGNNLLVGDPGCGSGFAAVGFLPSGSLSGCTNYTLLGDGNGGTYLNSSGSGFIHFRYKNGDLASIGQSPNIGVYGTSAGASATGAGRGNAGVWGDSGGGAGSGYAGVLGTADGNSAGWFINNGASATVVARNFGSGNGVQGSTASSTGNGVYGSGGGGVYGQSIASDPDGFGGPGGTFIGYSIGLLDLAAGDGVDATGGNSNPANEGPAAGGTGILGIGGLGPGGNAPGGIGAAFFGGGGGGGGNDVGGDGVDGTAGSGAYLSGYAGNFNGDVNINGTIYTGAKDFRIDHPLDPANKYLVHASVESSEMKNIYDGNITTDSEGHATVQLPEWFEVLNTDFRYQLTVIGQFAQAIVAREIEHNQFEIRTSAPNVKVSWQVTGVRQDAYAKAHPLVVDQEKEERLRGFYIHPELYGAPPEKQIEWARHPQMMKKIQEVRAKQQAAIKAAVPPAAAEPR